MTNEIPPAAQRVVDHARSWLGTPYMHQASLKEYGCDCLGLLRGVWRTIEGVEPEKAPPYSSSWAETSKRERLLETAERYFVKIRPNEMAPGDVIIFRLRAAAVAKHCGILSAPGHFIHAYDNNAVVESVLSDFWLRALAGIFRFPSVVRERSH